VSGKHKVLVLAQRTWSVPDASTDAVQAARAHEKALGAARLEAKEAREAHGALEKECAAKDEIERVTSAAAEHDPATAAELQLLRESVEEVARCNAVADADAAAGAARAGVLGTTAESASPPAPTLAAATPPSPRRCSSARRATRAS
jgi:hypothetical protein